MPGDLGERSIRFFYTNYRGKRSIRVAVPVILQWGSSVWHPRPQWLMTAFDVDKGAERTFALEDCQFITCDASNRTTQATSSLDERPCTTDAFLASAVLDLDMYELNDACVAWVEGAWADAMKGIRSLEDGQ